MTEELHPCHHCKKQISAYINYCDWGCMVAEAKANGGAIHTPNDLPIRSIKRDGSMWEHEHGDHPDYKFPVDVEHVNPSREMYFISGPDLTRVPMSKEQADAHNKETHALIYSNRSVALTLYECCHALWNLKRGEVMHSSLHKPKEWKLTDESLEKIRALHPVKST